MTADQEAERWTWPCYNPPGLLIGPLPYIKNPSGRYAPDYRHPGVAARVRVEVDFVVDQEPYRN